MYFFLGGPFTLDQFFQAFSFMALFVEDLRNAPAFSSDYCDFIYVNLGLCGIEVQERGQAEAIPRLSLPGTALAPLCLSIHLQFPLFQRLLGSLHLLLCFSLIF